jgi:hypothetical protein
LRRKEAAKRGLFNLAGHIPAVLRLLSFDYQFFSFRPRSFLKSPDTRAIDAKTSGIALAARSRDDFASLGGT